MPLSTPYTWRQTEEELVLEVALKAPTLGAADVERASSRGGLPPTSHQAVRRGAGAASLTTRPPAFVFTRPQ